MATLETKSDRAHAYLTTIKREQWVRAFFPLPRYGHVTSNIAVAKNSWLLECRTLPLMFFFHETIRKINTPFSKRREFYEKGDPNDIEEDVLVKIVKNTDEG